MKNYLVHSNEFREKLHIQIAKLRDSENPDEKFQAIGMLKAESILLDVIQADLDRQLEVLSGKLGGLTG